MVENKVWICLEVEETCRLKADEKVEKKGKPIP